jgi:hypothetical protein
VLLSAATLLTSIKPSPIAIFLYWCEEQGSSSSSGSEPSTIADYFSLSPTQHAYGFAGGFVWAIGTLSNLVGGSGPDLRSRADSRMPCTHSCMQCRRCVCDRRACGAGQD